MPPRATGREGDRQVELLLLSSTLHAKTNNDLWDVVYEAPSVDACKAFARERYGVSESDWQEASVTVEDMMKAYAKDAIDSAHRDFGVHLDLSIGSLQEVEKILGRLYDSKPRGLKKLFQRKTVELDLETLSKVWGGYIGEVIRRNHGGQWRIAEDLYPDTVVYALRVETTDIFPPAKVYKRLTNGPEDDVWFYYCVLKERILTA